MFQKQGSSNGRTPGESVESSSFPKVQTHPAAQSFSLLDLKKNESSKTKTGSEQEAIVAKTTLVSTTLDIAKRFGKAHPSLMVANLGIVVGDVASAVGIPLLTGALVHAATKVVEARSLGHDVLDASDALIFPAGALVAMWGITHISRVFRDWVGQATFFRAWRTFEDDFSQKLASRSIETLESPGFSDRMARVRENFHRIPQFLARNFELLSASCTSVGVVYALFTQNVLAGLTFGACGVWQVINEKRYAQKSEKLEKDISEKRRKYWHYRQDIQSKDGLRELKGLDKTEAAIAQVTKQDRSFTEPHLSNVREHGIQSVAPNIATVAVKAVVLGTMISSLITGKMEPSAVVSVIGLVVSFETALTSISKIWGRQTLDFSTVKEAINIDQHGAPDCVPGKSYTPYNPARGPEIILRGIEVRDPTQEKQILSDVSLRFESGKIYGIVGDSGAGKTSLIKVLTSQKTPFQGSVTFDGIPVTDISPRDLRRTISLLSQDFHDFKARTVRDAILLGDRGAEISTARLDKAMEQSAIDFLGANNEGLDQFLGQDFKNSRDFSGGERHRIALARALVGDSECIIFDEPTSKLGIIHEDPIIRALKEQNQEKKRTVIIISHRYANLVDVDEIIFLQHGKVLERGSHQQLMALGGHYARRFTLERKRYSGE